jgi:hypothetical protein
MGSDALGKAARIRAALVGLVGRQRYEATSVEQICAEAGGARENIARRFAYLMEDGWRDGLRVVMPPIVLTYLGPEAAEEELMIAAPGELGRRP